MAVINVAATCLETSLKIREKLSPFMLSCQYCNSSSQRFCKAEQSKIKLELKWKVNKIQFYFYSLAVSIWKLK